MKSKDNKGFITIATGSTISKQKIYGGDMPERSIAQPLPTVREVEAEESDENLTEEEIEQAKAEAIENNTITKPKKRGRKPKKDIDKEEGVEDGDI